MIKLDKFCVKAGDFSLREVSLQLPTGAYGVLMGRTGSGKTMVLEGICGLRRIDSGRVILLDRDVSGLKPGQRGIGYVPQDGALFPTMSVRDHLSIGPVIRRWPKSEIKKRVDELAEILGLGPLLERKPMGLSGGEIQRVALGRALASRPRILCLDEPLAALDAWTHEEICQLLIATCRQSEVTTLHVTHNRTEMERLASHLFILEDGVVKDLSVT